MVVTNQGTAPVRLEVGEVLGELQPASVVLEGGLADGKETEAETHVGAAPSTAGKEQQTEESPQKVTCCSCPGQESERERKATVGSVKTGEHRLTTRGTLSASESSGRVW